jgi:hypothetical protein
VTPKPWLVLCSCGWERKCSSEWAAQSIAKLHPQFASKDVAHVTRVEPGHTSIAQQLTPGNAEHEGTGCDDSARRDINVSTHDSQVEGPRGSQPERDSSMRKDPDIEYRGHFIDIQSYESEGRRWRPRAIVSIYRSGTLHQQTLSAPGEVLLESEEAAETYSLAMAKKWIDNQG